MLTRVRKYLSGQFREVENAPVLDLDRWCALLDALQLVFNREI